MRCCSKITGDRFVTRLAAFRANEFRAWNARRRKNRAICFERAAREQDHGQRACSPKRPQQFFAFTMQPSSWPQDSHVTAVLSERPKRDNAFLRRKIKI